MTALAKTFPYTSSTRSLRVGLGHLAVFPSMGMGASGWQECGNWTGARRSLLGGAGSMERRVSLAPGEAEMGPYTQARKAAAVIRGGARKYSDILVSPDWEGTRRMGFDPRSP